MRVVFAGTPAAALPSLAAIAQSRHDLVAVVTRPDAPTGRGRRLTASPVAQAAAGLGVPILKPTHPRDVDFQDELRALAPDVCAVVAYGALLPQSALEIPPEGWINLHFSLLPAWRGAAPVQRAIWAGEEFTGATTFRIVKELDAGPVFGVMTQAILPEDTAESLLSSLALAGSTLLVGTLDGIESGTIGARAQPSEGITLAPKLSVEEAQVDWQRPAVLIARQVRACWPSPGAWTTWQGERFKIGPGVEVIHHPLAPGELAVTKSTVVVGTGYGSLALGDVKAFGKKQMAADAWARGEASAPGGRFG